MNCIIVDDEPLAREAIEILVKDTSQLNLTGMFNNAIGAFKVHGRESSRLDLFGYSDVGNHGYRVRSQYIQENVGHFHHGLHGIRFG